MEHLQEFLVFFSLDLLVMMSHSSSICAYPSRRLWPSLCSCLCQPWPSLLTAWIEWAIGLLRNSPSAFIPPTKITLAKFWRQQVCLIRGQILPRFATNFILPPFQKECNSHFPMSQIISNLTKFEQQNDINLYYKISVIMLIM